ncbi:hypothetical protein CYMTET_2681 [Cymbomonas tetramitiformis]|uniref:FAD-binding FR-type domain-containing protein n=1 Tax=Cymbomonas tetramitiformis TaxID=36881 RepID=A0AAE0H4V0_9CHLO|nr:hypothetical protein CYMTET_2681 [Cymbomonas tetramitiformis]
MASGEWREVDDRFRLRWWTYPDTREISFEMSAPSPVGYLSIGFGEVYGWMAPADCVVGWLDDETGEAVVSDRHLPADWDPPIIDNTRNVIAEGGGRGVGDAGWTFVRFRRAWNTGDDEADMPLHPHAENHLNNSRASLVNMIWATHERHPAARDGDIAAHTVENRGAMRLALLMGRSNVTSVISGTKTERHANMPQQARARHMQRHWCHDSGRFCLGWALEWEERSIRFLMEAPVGVHGYVSVGFGDTYGMMTPSDCVYGWMAPDGSAIVSDRRNENGYAQSVVDARQDAIPLFAAYHADENTLGVAFRRALQTNDTIADAALMPGVLSNVIWAIHGRAPETRDGPARMHSVIDRGAVLIDFVCDANGAHSRELLPCRETEAPRVSHTIVPIQGNTSLFALIVLMLIILACGVGFGGRTIHPRLRSAEVRMFRGSIENAALLVYASDENRSGEGVVFGGATMVSLAVLMSASAPWVRQHFFRFFSSTHRVAYISIALFLAMHARDTRAPLAVCVTLWFADRAHRCFSRRRSCDFSVRELPGDAVELLLALELPDKDDSPLSSRVRGGQYAYINVPTAAFRFAWHPFTVAEAAISKNRRTDDGDDDDGDDVRTLELRFVIRKRGKFSTRLASGVWAMSPTSSIHLDGYFDGPISKACERLVREPRDQVIMIAGGTGITCILPSAERLLENRACRGLYLIWVCRGMDAFWHWFAPDRFYRLRAAENIDVRIRFVSTARDGIGSDSIVDEESWATSSSSIHLTRGERPCFNEEITRRLSGLEEHSKAAILVCGPVSMIADARKTAAATRNCDMFVAESFTR